MAASSTTLKNIHHMNTFVFVCVHWECCVGCRLCQLLPQNTERSHPCLVGSCIPCSWTLVKMQQISSCFRGSHHSLFGLGPSARFLVAWRTFSCRLTWDYPTSNFESPNIQFPVACPTPFKSSAFPRFDQRSQTSWRDFLTPFCSRSTRHGLAFAIGEHSFEISSWPFFHMALCFLTWSSERKSLKWLQEYIEKIHMNNRRKWFPFISWETSFGYNISELVFGVNIFDLDFWFQMDSVQQPIKNNSVSPGHVSHRCTAPFNFHFDHGFVVLKDVCTTETHLEKSVRLWVRNPPHWIDQPSVFFWPVGSWFWNKELHQFPGGLNV